MEDPFSIGKGNPHNDFAACAYLFSPEAARTRGFIDTLDLPELKSAFRKKARQYHPDLHRHEDRAMKARRQERFVRIRQSYEHLCVRVKKQQPQKREEARPQNRPFIIAVGGAKGGIGKSIFAANLSVHLAGRGYRTVAADLDLGGANLHLYLGRPMIRRSINDFLSGTVPKISGALEPTKYGSSLLGGNSSRLGSANISFTRKLKLLRAIRALDADYVVMDLGGDTAYNVLDFFLAADLGLVMTTCEPAAYLEAYAFIKVALYRKLNRLHGPESMTAAHTDPILKKLIYETTAFNGDPLVGDIEALIQRIKQEHPASLGVIRQALGAFTPKLMVNKAPSEAKAREPVARIQQVSLKKLSIKVGKLHPLPYSEKIAQSARTLVPWAANGTARDLTKRFTAIADTLLGPGQ